MRFSAIVLSVLSLIAFSGAVQARQAPLVDPAPVAIPAGLSQGKAVKDIKRALIGRGWTISAEREGEIDSTLNLRDHVAKIRVSWDATSVRIVYVDSVNLSYREKRGKKFIHPNYLGWISNIANDMGTNMQLSAMEN
ncbi:MAG: hypothetical protein KA144_06250 [Xanthomonadaceae bacterium]|nr:hypothetical protein [Xanthomonadaceae bacterium]